MAGTTPPTSTCPSSISCGRRAGKTAPCGATRRTVFSPIPPKSTACGITGPAIRWMPFTCPSRRCSGRRCCTRQARRVAAASLPRRTPSASSFSGADKRITRDLVADIRSRAAAHGRDAKDILIFYNRAAVVGRTRRDAEQKYREYHQHASIEGALAHFSSSTGLDFSQYAPDEPIRYVKNDAINSAVDTLTTLSAEPWTLRRIVGRMGLGSRNPAIVGSAEEVADDLIAWVEETDIDGFNLSRIVTPEGLEDFVALVVPILQERGVYKRDYQPGTLREKLFAGSRLLPASHPAAAHRRPDAECRQ